MITDDVLAALAREFNATPDAASRAARYRALVDETNHLVREAADSVLTLDATPLSFEALKERHRAGGAGS